MKDRSTFRHKRLSLAVLLALDTPAALQLTHAGSGWGDSTDANGGPIKTPTYYANSPSGLLPAADCFLDTPPNKGTFDTLLGLTTPTADTPWAALVFSYTKTPNCTRLLDCTILLGIGSILFFCL